MRSEGITENFLIEKLLLPSFLGGNLSAFYEPNNSEHNKSLYCLKTARRLNGSHFI